MILSHKKPSSTAELIGNSDAFAAAKEWADGWQKSGKGTPLLVCGPSGTGKTALAYALASELGWGLFEFNASDMRDEENVGKLLGNASLSSGLFGSMRLILIDDADSLSGRQDRGGAAAIAKLLQSARQPIIVTALDYYDRKLQSIRTHCMRLELRRVNTLSIAKLLRTLASSQKFGTSEEDIGKIASGSGGDVRAALNDLQGKNTSARRDARQNIFEVLRKILKGEKYFESRMAAIDSEVDHDTLKLWVAHNLPLEYERPFDMAEGYSALSRADVFDGRIGRGQYYGYLRYSNDLLSAGVATAKTAPYRKYTQYGFPDYLREMSASKGSRAQRKAILQKIARACHCSLSQAQTYMPIFESLGKKHPAEVASEFGFDEDEMMFVTKTKTKAKVKEPSEKVPTKKKIRAKGDSMDKSSR